MKTVKQSALVSLVVGVCHVMAACGDDGEGSGGASGTTSGDTTTGTADATTTTTTTTTTATSSSTGGDGGGGGTPSDPCEPTDGEVIPPTCGIFVDGDAKENGNGQQDSPYNNLADAVKQAGGANNRIYVCGDLREPVTVPEGLEIHGEIQCGSWQWDFEVRTLWEAFGDSVPLHFVGGATPTVITGFRIEARDAVAAGQSSIAVIAEGGTLSLVRSDVVAGDAADGEPGAPGAAGATGTNGGVGGVGFDETGGVGGVSSCGGVTGGTGASQGCIQDLNGGCAAEPLVQSTLNPGGGGVSAATTCTAGDTGMPGIAGAPGPDGIGSGVIGPEGFVGLAGGPGTAGGVGGPGGGGGAKTDTDLWGGGGATGGCGSQGSTGGTGGGSSFAIVSLNATVLFEDVTAVVGIGGNGGAGGASTPGGAGGLGGAGGCALLIGCTPQFTACRGGHGGPGGAGGAGGNGAGGHAAIIAYSGVQNSLAGLSPVTPVGQNGLGGGNLASDGQSAVELQFP